MANLVSFYTIEEYAHIIAILSDPAVTSMLEIEPVDATKSPLERKVYHAVVKKEGKVLGEVTILGKPNYTNKDGISPSLIFTSQNEENNQRVKDSLEKMLELDKIRVVS
ncbi:hypothetical protein COU56_03435 [Candidatus Pacearchaeota archaeon CG10_big_fil_rev_8_21_14_0_10_31_9]|nr:MAG: hypothetical protein AUJ62_01555 [Candidatus Pacearchaeota archaeon CG1_02_32_21]PIN93670.1 MAG: hypothetical protein COU56_03435 [Candidatus Pacearchaeota archaeon CG10_big_fil_rev_8_21_14_0_10_31_9]PIZ83163.1 MAG: hypothetical protein COX97_01530 [Candidatus Pacearchaeota archaeon CG_4_10_14_0_2_um_filter_05_32_18]